MAKLEDVVDKVRGIADSKIDDKERFHAVLDILADYFVEAMVRDEARGQAAVLMVVRGGRQLAFAHPKHLVSGNCFPMNKKSIAGRTVLDKRAIIENQVASEEHHGFYERVPNPDGEVRPIQKMISCPMIGPDGVIGVIQVSRTGEDITDAGLDFSEDDSQRLEKLCKIFAPVVAKTWTREDVL